MTGYWLAALLFALAWIGLQPAAADPYQGALSALQDDVEYRLVLTVNDRGRYEGELAVNGGRHAVDAQRLGERIAGQISGAGGYSAFVAEVQGRGLAMRRQDGTVLIFRRREEK